LKGNQSCTERTFADSADALVGMKGAGGTA
jgi:hypothetical protein